MKRNAALITGGAKRIGAFIAKVLAKNGFDIAVHYNSSKRQALEIKKSIIDNFNVNACCLHLDFLKCKNPELLIEDALQLLPNLNILVNNASVFNGDDIHTLSDKTFNDHYRIHVYTPFFLIQRFLLIKNPNLKIINIIDNFINKKSTKNYFSYLFSKKCMSVMTDMIKDYALSNNLDVKIYGIYPKKILEEGIENAENLPILEKEIEQILKD